VKGLVRLSSIKEKKNSGCLWTTKCRSWVRFSKSASIKRRTITHFKVSNHLWIMMKRGETVRGRRDRTVSRRY
jgi:hypothetical protein